jgi:hypothetical protein
MQICNVPSLPSQLAQSLGDKPLNCSGSHRPQQSTHALPAPGCWIDHHLLPARMSSCSSRPKLAFFKIIWLLPFVVDACGKVTLSSYNLLVQHTQCVHAPRRTDLCRPPRGRTCMPRAALTEAGRRRRAELLHHSCRNCCRAMSTPPSRRQQSATRPGAIR